LHDTNNPVYIPVERELLAKSIGLAAKAPLPERITQNNARRRSGAIVFIRCEETAQRRTSPQQREEVR
jgi:hypothetical protein